MRGGAYRLAKCGQLRRRLTCDLDTWICKFGTVPGSMNCVETKFELQGRKWEEYRGTRYYDGDSALVVELWLHRVADDTSGLTFQEWDPSAGTDDKSAPVVMLVNSSELRHGLLPRGSESSTTRLGGSRRPSYARRGSEKTSGCGQQYVCTLRGKRQ